MKRKSRKSAKKRAIKKVKTVERIRTEAAVKEANRRIKVIEKTYPEGKYTWGITKLKNTIPQFIKNGKVSIPKGASYIDLINIRKSTMKFINSKVSTKKGIEGVKEKTLQTFRENFADFDEEEVSYDDVETFYKMFEDEEYTYFIKMTGIKASDLDIIINYATRENWSQNKFLDSLNMYTTIVDEDIRYLAIKLYEKYVRK